MFPKTLLPFALLAAPVASACTVTPTSIAGIRLGQTPAQVQRALPQAQIRSEADAETGEITLITLPQKIEVFALLNDNTQQITWLETPSPACRTAHGIRPRMALRDAEKTLGKVRDIELSEVEMRSVARFARQPKWLNIRVRGGDFGNIPSARFRLPLHSKKFRRDARIESLFIAR